eukprot:13207383-Heterocapsa_arctica.AAC.1
MFCRKLATLYVEAFACVLNREWTPLFDQPPPYLGIGGVRCDGSLRRGKPQPVADIWPLGTRPDFP